MNELTDAQKAWIFELVDFVLEVKNDDDAVVYDDNDILDRVSDYAIAQPELEKLVNQLHEMGWSKHRKHDMMTGVACV